MRASPRSSTEAGRGWARLGRFGLLALLALPGWTGPAAAGEPTAAELRNRAQSVLADRRYQPSLPRQDSRGEPRPPQRSREEGGGGFSVGGDPEVGLPATGLSTLARVVLWVLLGAAAVLAVLRLAQAIPARRREPPAAALPERAAAAPTEPPAGDPAALAAQGRYGEAVHALLLAAIALLARRFRLPLPPSRTSRELLSALPLKGTAREAFAGLVQTVERSWFGGTPVGPEEYAASVERFHSVSGSAGREA